MAGIELMNDVLGKLHKNDLPEEGAEPGTGFHSSSWSYEHDHSNTNRCNAAKLKPPINVLNQARRQGTFNGTLAEILY